MLLHPHILLTFLLLAISACVEPEAEIVPVIPPPSTETVQQAQSGHATAQFALAEYHRGDEDPTVMLRWLRLSACQGHPRAQTRLGVLYDTGNSVPQDPITA